jgi:hypothetical protein
MHVDAPPVYPDSPFEPSRPNATNPRSGRTVLRGCDVEVMIDPLVRSPFRRPYPMRGTSRRGAAQNRLSRSSLRRGLKSSANHTKPAEQA